MQKPLEYDPVDGYADFWPRVPPPGPKYGSLLPSARWSCVLIWPRARGRAVTSLEMSDHVIELRHLKTHYTVMGDGPDVLWVSGGGIRGADWHAHFVPLLANSHRNITFDNRGILGTTCVQPLPWSIADMAADTAELLERLCERPAIVIGHSMGAFIAVQLALDRPDPVS